MKQNTLIKQAYVRGLAARGLLRQYAMQKQAEGEETKTLGDYAGDVIDQAGLKNSLKDYAVYGGIGAAGGATLGALIQSLRKKDLLSGILAGAGVGGGLGLGTRAALNVLNQTGVTSDERLDAAKGATKAWLDPKERAARGYMTDDSNKDMFKNVAISGGIGAAGGGIIGALIQAARQKNVLLGAGLGASIGGIGGIGVGAAPYITAFAKDHAKRSKEAPRRLTESEQRMLDNFRMRGYDSLGPEERLLYDELQKLENAAVEYAVSRGK